MQGVKTVLTDKQLDYLARIEYCFSHGPEWAEGLPLKGAGYTGPFYYKD